MDFSKQSYWGLVAKHVSDLRSYEYMTLLKYNGIYYLTVPESIPMLLFEKYEKWGGSTNVKVLLGMGATSFEAIDDAKKRTWLHHYIIERDLRYCPLTDYAEDGNERLVLNQPLIDYDKALAKSYSAVQSTQIIFRLAVVMRGFPRWAVPSNVFQEMVSKNGHMAPTLLSDLGLECLYGGYGKELPNGRGQEAVRPASE